MEMMTREQMIEQARETRKKVTNASVSEEEMNAVPVTMQPQAIPTRVGDSRAYYSYAKGGEGSDTLIINFHGGGFIRERTPNDELFCRKLNHALGCKTLDIDYRIAPDDPYPAAAYEVYDAVQWVAAHSEQYGIDRSKIILMGHSAGGNLIVGAVMRALAEKTFVPRGLVVEYPPLDIYTDPADKPPRGKGIPFERARLYNLYYCDRERQKEPYCSPVYATDEQLHGFPPSLFITAGQDDLCTEAEDFALHLARCDNEVTVRRFEGVGHAFTIYRRDRHEEAFALIIKYVQSLLCGR